MKKSKTVFRVFSVIISVILSVALCISLVSLTVLSVSRTYLTSAEFKSTIDNTDLATLTFYADGNKITLDRYVKDYVTNNLSGFIKDNPLSNYTNILNPFVDSVTDFVVDKALSSDFVNTTVKNEVHSIFEHLLYSDVGEAKKRIKDGITLENNYKLDPNNASTYEEKVSAEVKIAVFKYIEEESGLSIDRIIVLLSQGNITYIKSLCALFLALLIMIAVGNFPGLFLYFTLILWGYKGFLYYLTTDFKEHFVGNEDLIAHQLLKPMTDSLSSYGDSAFKLSFVFIAIFFVVVILLSLRKRKKK